MKCASALSIVFLLSAGSAFAQTSPPQTHPARAALMAAMPCNGQYEKYCSTVEPGAGRKLICMTQHLSQLTPACRTRIQAVYKLESELAAKNHMTVPQYMAWGQELQTAAKAAHTDYKIKPAGPAPAPPAPTQSGSKPSSNQSSPKQN